MITVYGTYFRSPEQGKAFFSHKFKKYGLRYEVGLCILTGDTIWFHSPFPCGRYNDIMIFRHALKDFLEENERVDADDGYLGEAPLKVKCPNASQTLSRIEKNSREFAPVRRP